MHRGVPHAFSLGMGLLPGSANLTPTNKPKVMLGTQWLN